MALSEEQWEELYRLKEELRKEIAQLVNTKLKDVDPELDEMFTSADDGTNALLERLAVIRTLHRYARRKRVKLSTEYVSGYLYTHFDCPECSEAHELEGDAQGTEYECPDCGAMFMVRVL